MKNPDFIILNLHNKNTIAYIFEPLIANLSISLFLLANIDINSLINRNNVKK